LQARLPGARFTPSGTCRRLARTDANIDHRRVPDLMACFHRTGQAAPTTVVAADYLPADTVAGDLGHEVVHGGIVGARGPAAHLPRVIHYIGAGEHEDDILFRFGAVGRPDPVPRGIEGTHPCCSGTLCKRPSPRTWLAGCGAMKLSPTVAGR